MPQHLGQPSSQAGHFQKPRPPQHRVQPVDDDLDERRELVAELHAQGRSLRAIAAELGVSHETIRKDLAAVNLTVSPPGGQLTAGLTGERYERVEMDEDDFELMLWWNGRGEMFFDRELRHPAGLVLVRVVKG